MKYFLIIITLTYINMIAQTKYQNINEEIAKGNFSEADKMIEKIIAEKNISEVEKNSLLFEIERHNRIRKDFKKTGDDVLEYVKKFLPNANKQMLAQWEKDGSLEYKIIDGKKLYFNRSYTNLFRINKELKKIKSNETGNQKESLDLFLEKIVPEIIADIKDNKDIYASKEKIKLNYTITVPPNTIPEGELLKCWIPYPREGNPRQEIISFTSKDKFAVADNSNLQRSVYFEKVTKKDKPTIFNYELIIETRGVNFDIQPKKVKPYLKNDEYKKYTSQREPHIVFTNKIKTLSKTIVGDEKNSYLIAKNIFAWISNNIPWAGAREYSTLTNISDYCLTNMHGDCGIKTLLFMTLARYNGIPTKWESGWMLHPGELNLHDWCKAYFEGYGWVPVDQSFGLVDSENEDVKYFYLGGIDQYRFIVNEDFSQPFFPAKEHFRSETIDFQRGEVEWKGTNLYFDKWNYDMKIEYLGE